MYSFSDVFLSLFKTSYLLNLLLFDQFSRKNSLPHSCYFWNSRVHSMVHLKKKENSVKLTIKHFLQTTIPGYQIETRHF